MERLNTKNKDIRLIHESIDHWKRMIERCRYQLEIVGEIIFEDYMKQNVFFINVIKETPKEKDCPLCEKYSYKKDSMLGCNDKCPIIKIDCSCDSVGSSWRKTTENLDLKKWVEAAEKYMLSTLLKCLKAEIGKENE